MMFSYWASGENPSERTGLLSPIQICATKLTEQIYLKEENEMEMRGIDPRTSRMLSERSTI